MASETSRGLAQLLFQKYAFGYSPSQAEIDSWAERYENTPVDDRLNIVKDFGNIRFYSPGTPLAEAIMAPQSQYNLSMDLYSGGYSAQGQERFLLDTGRIGEKTRMEMDAGLRNWYNIFSEGQGLERPADYYVSFLNGRDGTYLDEDYRAAKARMTSDALAQGFYGGEAARPMFGDLDGQYNRWLATQVESRGFIPGETAPPPPPQQANVTVGNQPEGTFQGYSERLTGPVDDWFRKYVTGFEPSADTFNWWNNRIAQIGYDAAFREFLNPSDPNAPRNATMFADPDYIAWQEANGGGAGGGGGGGGGGVPGAGGGLNFFGTQIQPGFYSERGFEAEPVPFGTPQGQMTPQQLFETYATGFTPNQEALDFWGNKISELGYNEAVRQFLNPSDMNAPRNATMFADPEYQAAIQQGPSYYQVNPTVPAAMFRSGVAGYTNIVPSGFQFGIQPVNYTTPQFIPGKFDPGVINAEGQWTPTPPASTAPVTPVELPRVVIPE